jgi:hypothetical protein
MKIVVVTRKEFELAEQDGLSQWAKHLANSGVRTVAVLPAMKNEIKIAEDGTPNQVQTAFVTLVNTADQSEISAVEFGSPDINTAMRAFSSMPELLVKIWTSKENKANGVKAEGSGKRGRKSNAERERLAREAEERAKLDGVSAPETAEDILAAAQAAAAKKGKAVAGAK